LGQLGMIRVETQQEKDTKEERRAEKHKMASDWCIRKKKWRFKF